MTDSFTVVKAGLETSIQDYPGRIGYWALGIPPSGPMDSLAFRLANLLVGNAVGAAALEIQFIGPAIRFERDGVIALTGADMKPMLEERAIPLWRSVPVRAGQILRCGFAQRGARGYLAFDGGIETPSVLGSRSTFHRAGIGGVDGRALKDGQVIALGRSRGTPTGHAVRPDVIPTYGSPLSIEVMAGPHDDWLDDTGRELFLSATWRVSAQSDRTGMRLEGPSLGFSSRALNKPPENGMDPTNIINNGYAIGGINLCGQTPIILPVDGPSEGGFITPFTVVSAALWKLGQARPHDVIRFVAVTPEKAIAMRRQLDAQTTEASLERVTADA